MQQLFVHPVFFFNSGATALYVSCPEEFIVVAADTQTASSRDPETRMLTISPYLPWQTVFGYELVNGDIRDQPCSIPGVAAAGFDGLPYSRWAHPGATVLVGLRVTSSCLYIATRSSTPPDVSIDERGFS